MTLETFKKVAIIYFSVTLIIIIILQIKYNKQ